MYSQPALIVPRFCSSVRYVINPDHVRISESEYIYLITDLEKTLVRQKNENPNATVIVFDELFGVKIEIIATGKTIVTNCKSSGNFNPVYIGLFGAGIDTGAIFTAIDKCSTIRGANVEYRQYGKKWVKKMGKWINGI